MSSSFLNFNQNPIRIIIIDDRRLIRETLQIYLETETDITIVGKADTGATGLDQIKQLNPDIAVVDLEKPDLDGIAAIRIIREYFPTTKVLVLSGHEEPEYINRAIKAGAKGYLLKGTSPRDLADAIRYISKGYLHLGPGLLEKLALISLERTITESQEDIEAYLAKPLQQFKLEAARHCKILIDRNFEDRLVRPLEQFKLEVTKQCKILIDQNSELYHKKLNDVIELKLYNLKNKQLETAIKLKKLQQRNNLLSVSQIFLWLIMLFYFIFDKIL